MTRTIRSHITGILRTPGAGNLSARSKGMLLSNTLPGTISYPAKDGSLIIYTSWTDSSVEKNYPKDLRQLLERAIAFKREMIILSDGEKETSLSMLTISTAHIDRPTIELLENAYEKNYGILPNCRVLTDKDGSGFILSFANPSPEPKTCLEKCIAFAADLGCNMLCMDMDGYKAPYLETYNWEE